MRTAENEDRNASQLAGLRLSVVSVTYNSAEVLPGLLDSLKEGLAGVEAVEIVIADNDSVDASVEIALDHPCKPRVVQMGRNAGYAAGINAASAVIRKDANLLIMNPDIRLMPGAARVLLERLSDPSVVWRCQRFLKLMEGFRGRCAANPRWSQGGLTRFLVGHSLLVWGPEKRSEIPSAMKKAR